jgi:hypothetical protein
MYLAYVFLILALLVPCVLALYVWRLYRGGDEDAPDDPPPPPHPSSPDPVDSPVSYDLDRPSSERDRNSERTPSTVHA